MTHLKAKVGDNVEFTDPNTGKRRAGVVREIGGLRVRMSSKIDPLDPSTRPEKDRRSNLVKSLDEEWSMWVPINRFEVDQGGLFE